MKSLILLDLYTVPYSFNKPAIGISQIVSIFTIVVVLFTAFMIIQNEIITRSFSSIVYIGLQDTKYREDTSFQIELNVSSNFKCNMFYTVTGNTTPNYFDYNLSLIKDIRLPYLENGTTEYDLMFFTRCSDKLVFNKLYYELDLTYEATQNNFFDIVNPVSKYWITYSNFGSFRLSEYDRTTPETLPYRQFILNYYYNKIVDDKNYFINDPITSDKNAKYYISVNDIMKYETIQPLPQIMGQPPFTYYPTAHLFSVKFTKNNNICNLTRRNFTLIPQMLAKIVGVFSSVKFGSLMFLYFFSYFSKDLSVINKVFDFSYKHGVSEVDKCSSKKSKSVYSIVINNDNQQREALKQNVQKIKTEVNFFSLWDNIRFCCPIKTKKSRSKYSLFTKLREWKSIYHEFDYWIIMMNNLKNNFLLENPLKPQVLINEDDAIYEVI